MEQPNPHQSLKNWCRFEEREKNNEKKKNWNNDSIKSAFENNK